MSEKLMALAADQIEEGWIKFDHQIEKALADFTLKHAETVDCLVCEAIKKGLDARTLELVTQHNADGSSCVYVRRREGV